MISEYHGKKRLKLKSNETFNFYLTYSMATQPAITKNNQDILFEFTAYFECHLWQWGTKICVFVLYSSTQALTPVDSGPHDGFEITDEFVVGIDCPEQSRNSCFIVQEARILLLHRTVPELSVHKVRIGTMQE